MPSHILSCLQRIASRFKESRVFQLNPEPAWHISVLRWITLIFYGWLGAVLVYLVWPWLSYLRPEHWFSLEGKPGLYGVLQITWICVAVLLVLTLQDKFFIRFPRKRRSVYCIDIQTFVRYPTLHVSVVTGILILLSAFNTVSVADGSGLLVISSEMLHFPVSVTEKDTRIVPELAADGLGMFFWFYAFVLAVRTEYRIRKAVAEASQLKSKETLDLLACSDDQFRSWLLKEEDTKALDFFKREPYITRMLKRIIRSSSNSVPQEDGQQNSKGQVLLGEFGSGKTTIVNLLEKELDPEWIVSRFDCWQRSGKPQELAAQFIEQAIHDVGQQIEVTSLVGLPESFATALYGSNHWWNLLDIWFRPGRPEEVIAKLDTLLKVNNRKLLLVVENVDRNEERGHFINIIAAILDKLQQAQGTGNIHFIFSADEALLDAEFLYRIADYRERVANFIPPDLLIRFMALCLDGALNKQDDGESLIIPYLSKGFSLPEDAQGKIEAVKHAFEISSDDDNDKSSAFSKESIENQVLMALTNILSNPRRLKHVLRDMYQRWMDELRGEVNLFDLLLYCTANDEGSIRVGMEQFTPDILNGSGYDPFTSGIRKKWNKDDDNNQPEIPEYGDADVIAFYLLNGYISPGQSCRPYLCQPVIDEGGVLEESFVKYRKVVDIGVVKDYAASDQEFLKNYIKASADNGDQDALKVCLSFAQSSSNNLVIFETLLETMTKEYFSSVTELYQFTYHAIALADSRYVGTMNGVLRALIKLCFDVMNFDGSGGESHADKLKEKLTDALKELDERKQYSYLLRSLSFFALGGENNLRSRAINSVAKSVFTRELSKRMAAAFRENYAGTHELQYEYILFLRACEKASHIINKEILCEACHSFLIVVGERLEVDLQVLEEFVQKYPDRLRDIKDTIRHWLDVETLTSIELNAWKELERVLPDKSDDSDKEQQPD